MVSLKDIDTSNKAGKRTALTGAGGALVSSLSRPWALWNGVSTDDVQKGKWITKLNHLQTQESGKLLFGQFLHRNFGLHLRQQAPCGSAGPLNATKQEGTARTHTARVIALTDTSESRRSERCESLRMPQRRRSFGGRLVPIIGLADFTSQIERNLYKIENRQTLPALVRYKCMTPFVLIQQGHCLSLYIRQKERKWIRGNLLFQNLLLVHPVGDARDGVLVVASVRRHCRWMGTLFFLVTNSVHMHC